MLRIGRLRQCFGLFIDPIVNERKVAPQFFQQLDGLGRLLLAEQGKLDLGEHMVSRRMKLDEINDAFKAMEAGEVIRSVISGPSSSSSKTGAASAQGRTAGRAELGLTPDDRAVLIVAGSWGVGGVADTFRLVGAGGEYVPIEHERALLIVLRRSVRSLVVGGEPLPAALVERLMDRQAAGIGVVTAG